MKDKVLVFLVSKAGGLITPAIAIVVAAVVSRLAMIDPKLAESVDQTTLTGFIVALILSLVNYFTNKEQIAGVKKIQALVNTTQDGVVGPITYTEVRRAIEVPAAKKPACSRKKKQ
jgi:uncharacterized YccA/Bax inhibitor family protein